MPQLLKFELVDNQYYMADMSDIDKSGRWVIAKDNKRYKAGIEHPESPNTMPVIWLVENLAKYKCEQYLNTLHQVGRTYNDFNN